MKKKLPYIILCVVLLIGLSLLLYPTFSDAWNKMHQSRAVASYVNTVSEMNDEEYDSFLQEANNYNKKYRTNTGAELSGEQRKDYFSILDVSGTGIMSYVEIPKIGCTLPIYHGTDNSILEVAVGHLEWTSLPVGGEGTHCVLSGHRGLPSARLFTDLDKLVNGDQFLLYTLNEVLTYEVDQINVVEPTDLSTLAIEEGKDYCTLFTCTPYGVNTHRLMVRGHRVETTSKKHILVTAEALQINEIIVALVIGVPILAIVFITVLLRPRKKKISEMRFGL